MQKQFVQQKHESHKNKTISTAQKCYASFCTVFEFFVPFVDNAFDFL